MLLDFITYYGTVISSYMTNPISDIGYMYPVAVGVLITIRLIKELVSTY